MSIHDNLGYLLVSLCKVHKRHAEAPIRELGLYLGQEMVLAELWKQESMSQVELVERLFIEAPTVTKMLQRMGKAGLVERRTDPEDARRSLVSLTDKGRELRKPVENVWHELDEAMAKGLREGERLLLRRMLEQMRGNLKSK